VFPRGTLSTLSLVRGGVVQLSRWELLDAVLSSGAPAIRQVSLHLDGAEEVRSVKARSGIGLLAAPRRFILDGILAGAAADAGADVRFGVGARTDRRASRTSITEFMAMSDRTVDGVADARARRPHHFAISSSADGHIDRRCASQLHSLARRSAYRSRSAAVCPHG
jgi:hypothetical protein